MGVECKVAQSAAACSRTECCHVHSYSEMVLLIPAMCRCVVDSCGVQMCC